MTTAITPIPKNVFYFEALLYASLGLDAVSVAFQDRTVEGDSTDTAMAASNLIAASLILLFVYLVWLAARQRKSWPRWVLSVSLALSALSLMQIISISGLQIDSLIEMVSCCLTGAGLAYSFSGDAKGWFNA